MGPREVTLRYRQRHGAWPCIRAVMTSTATGSRGKSAGDDAEIELGAMNGSEPGAESESSRSRLLSGDSTAAARNLLYSAHDATGKSGAVAAVLSYCVASISMTVINKFAVSGEKFTMNLLVLLCQCTVGVIMVWTAKMMGWIQIRALNMKDIKTWFPISTMLVFVIWTGSKALVRACQRLTHSNSWTSQFTQFSRT